MSWFGGGNSGNYDWNNETSILGGSYTEPDFKVDWNDTSGGGWPSQSIIDNWEPIGSYGGSSQSPSFSENFGKNFLDAYKNQKMGDSGGGGKFSSNVTPGSTGGHQVTSLGDKSRTKMIQYINPTAQVIPGGPGTPGRPGFGERLAGAAATAAIGSIFCDVRLKTDIAPLESTEINDALADVAFFVKEIRECA